MARDMDDFFGALSALKPMPSPAANSTRNIGSDLFHGGSVLPGDAGLHPGLYHRGLLQRVEQLGGSVIDMTPVAAIVPEGDGFNLETSQGPCGRAMSSSRRMAIRVIWTAISIAGWFPWDRP